MKWLGMVVGVVFALVGFISDILMVINWLTIYPRFPDIPNPDDAIKAEAWFFVISTLLAIAGIIIFRKSKR